MSSAYQMVAALAKATGTPFRRFGSFGPADNTTDGTTAEAFSTGAELVAGLAALAATSKRYYREITAPGMQAAASDPSMSQATFAEFAAANKFGAPLTKLLSDRMTAYAYSYSTVVPAAFWMRLVADIGLKSGPLQILTPSSK